MKNIVGFLGNVPAKLEGPTVVKSDLVFGKRIFIAYTSEGNCFIREMLVQGKAFMKPNFSWFAKGFIVWMDGGKPKQQEYEFSLKDSGIIPNDYNMHQTFHTREDAVNYIGRYEHNEMSLFENRKRERVAQLRAMGYRNSKFTRKKDI